VLSTRRGPKGYSNYPSGKSFVLYDGFPVFKESITASRPRIKAIEELTPEQKQFVGTLVDTEAAVGYFLKQIGQQRPVWIAYLSVKMKYRGDLAYLSLLTSSLPPSRSLNMNTITHQQDLRWSKQFQGVVAYTLIREVRQFLHNEKSVVEVNCILRHGPIVLASEPHPFVSCGGRRVRRGVWYWPSIDDEEASGQTVRSE
jgi:hypothetical protein